MHDRDGKLTATFDAALNQAGLRVLKSLFRSPNTVAFVERFIQTLGQECLDYFFVFGERHLNYLVSQFVDSYHGRRPHQGKGNDLLVRSERVERSFAHVCDAGGMRRSWLRGLVDVTKRYLIAVAAHNLGRILRKLCGIGKPKALEGAAALLWLAQLLVAPLRIALRTLDLLPRPRAAQLTLGRRLAAA